MILLKFQKEIKGNSKVKDHTDWIEVGSFQIGVGRAISAGASGVDRDTSTPSFSEVTLTRATDIASPSLFIEAAGGKSLEKATIHFLQTSGDVLQVYLEYELTDPIVSSYSVSSGGERPTESFALNFTQIAMKYREFTGKEQAKKDAKGWDLLKNQKLSVKA